MIKFWQMVIHMHAQSLLTHIFHQWKIRQLQKYKTVTETRRYFYYYVLLLINPWISLFLKGKWFLSHIYQHIFLDSARPVINIIATHEQVSGDWQDSMCNIFHQYLILILFNILWWQSWRSFYCNKIKEKENI